MKKILAIALCLCMVLCAVACGGTKEADYKLGMGIVVSMDDSATDNAQVDATVAAVVTDAEGKIVACRLDVAQNKMNVADGAVDTAATFQTKAEKGDAYGMTAAVNYGMDWNSDGVVKEWYEQAKAFESYVTGKTVAEVKAIATQTLESGYVIATDDALLTAGCTIQITDFIEAVAKACEDERAMSFKAVEGTFTLGVAANTTAAESVAATDDANGSVLMYSDFAAAVVVDGKIVATINDAIQPKITINTAGEIVEKSFTATKYELKEGYNMSTYGANLDNNGDGKVLEWYLQSEAFSNYVVGKTADEVAGMKTVAATQGSVGYMISADQALLDAGCTIQIGAMCAVVAEAANNAR